MPTPDQVQTPRRRPKAPVTLAQLVVTRDGLRRANTGAARKITNVINGAAPGNFDAELVVGLAIEADAYEPGPKARALLRGIEMSRQLLKETGGAFSGEQVQGLLGVTRQAIDKKVKDLSLLAVPGPSNHRYFPAVQFSESGTPLPGLKDVRAKLPMQNPFAILDFLVSPNDLLDGAKPIDLLRGGQKDLVVRAAELQLEQGA